MSKFNKIGDFFKLVIKIKIILDVKVGKSTSSL